MELKEIVAIAGIGGLHKIIGRTKSGLILESLNETKKRFATGIQDKVSVLEDISMYTEEGDVHLSEVLKKIHEAEQGGTSVPSSKDDAKTIRSFVNGVIRLDNDRVYDSDIKKLVSWYSLLKGTVDFAKLGEEKTEDAPEVGVKTEAEAPAEEKPKAKKAAAKKTTEDAGASEEKPKKAAAKKTAAKKAEDGEAPAKPKAPKKKKTDE